MPKTQPPDRFRFSASLRPVLTGVAAGALTTAFVLMLFAGLMTVRDVPQMLIAPMAIAAIGAGAAVSGFVCTRITRIGGLVHGALCGGGMTAVLGAAGMVMGGTPGIPALPRIFCIMLCALLGGVLGVNARRRSRR